MDRFELLAMSFCVPLNTSKQYDFKHQYTCPFHVVAPYLIHFLRPRESSMVQFMVLVFCIHSCRLQLKILCFLSLSLSIYESLIINFIRLFVVSKLFDQISIV